ncbi:dTDP-4-dehydrorhamnose 3,5-epimerase [Polaribacter sp.]|uniref:dTDP-4-dehydrorhamnose 3,5-epimerase n=1 Tax=Polaribacter sp. TaxID=1920175 RepID=UPI003F6BBAFB
MKIIKTELEDCFIIEPHVFKDERGSFFESFNKEVFKGKTGIDINFVQDNQSISKKGVIRGLHIQKGEYAQSKLIRVIKGEILDVVVDVRKESKTFGKTFSCILSEENKKQLFIPKGFLHGFATLKNDSIVFYKCDNYYNKEAEDGVVYNDSDLNIDWNLKEEAVILSGKDEELMQFKNFKM